MKIIRTAIGSMVTWGFIKEIQKHDVEVIGVDSDPNAYALHKLNGYVVPNANDPNYIDKMLNIVEIEEPDAIISGPEEELLVLAKNRDLFEDVVLLCPSYESLKICTDKLEVHNTCKRLGIPAPKIYPRDEIQDCYIRKPRFGRGSLGISRVSIEEILENHYLYKNDDYILEEYIKGKEYSIDILADREGNALSVVPRLRMQVVNGKSIRSRTVRDVEMIEQAQKIVKFLKLFGPSCIQCIKNEKGNHFIDINPRFGGGSILSIKADPTIIPNLIKLIKREETIPSEGHKKGLTMLRYYKEIYINE